MKAIHLISSWGSTLVALSSPWLSSCSLIVETESLGAGETAADCGSWQKLCPLDAQDAEGVAQCVDATSPQRGCAAESCEPCEVAGAVPRCNRAGGCGVAICQENYGDCDNDEDTGCEIQLLLDEQNCGACGRACSVENGAADCVSGVCQVVYCNSPYADCSDESAGCETNTHESKDHCGACNKPCSGTCEGGRCEK